MAGRESGSRISIPSARPRGYEKGARARDALGGLSGPCPNPIGIETSNSPQFRVSWWWGLRHVFCNLHIPSSLPPHIVHRVAGMDGVEIRLSTAFGKPEHAERRDDRSRPAAQQRVALAPAGRAVAVARRGDERDAIDQPPPFVVHQRHPAPAKYRDVHPTPAARQLDPRL